MSRSSIWYPLLDPPDLRHPPDDIDYRQQHAPDEAAVEPLGADARDPHLKVIMCSTSEAYLAVKKTVSNGRGRRRV